MENNLNTDDMPITITDLYIAYKKSKAEAFHDKNQSRALNFYDYESKLHENLLELETRINNFDITKIKIVKNTDFPYWNMPKSLRPTKDNTQDSEHFFTNSVETHQTKISNETEIVFRNVINASVEMHIISALWVNKIGHLIDAKLDDSAYGSRVVRIKPAKYTECEFQKPNYNYESSRIFQHYQNQYRAWKQKGFDAIRELHKASLSVIAITMDVAQFYHDIIPEFFKSQEFYKSLSFSNEEKDAFEKNKQLHENFIALLEEWNKKIGAEKGIPVGLTCSPILANAVLTELDSAIKEKLNPAYYGRYVDDMLMVFSAPGNVSSATDVLLHINDKVPMIELAFEDTNKPLASVEKGQEFNCLVYKKKFNGKEQILKLKKEKQKIFYLDKKSDLSFIDAIEAEINSISSEWRFLPDLLDDNSSLLKKIIGFYSDGSEFNDALRKIDSVTLKRLGLSILLSHANALQDFIDPSEWKEKRFDIYELIKNHIFIPENFFSNFNYLKRIFQLMISCGDWEQAYCFLESAFGLIDKLEKSKASVRYTNADVGAELDAAFKNFRGYFRESIIDGMCQAFISHKVFSSRYFELIKNKLELQDAKYKSFENVSLALFFADLGYESFASTFIKYYLAGNPSMSFYKFYKLKNKSVELFYFYDYTYWNGLLEFYNLLSSNLRLDKKIKQEFTTSLSLSPFLFPTRPLRPIDISIVTNQAENDFCKYEYEFARYIDAICGTHLHVDKKCQGKEYNSQQKRCANFVVNIKNKQLDRFNKKLIAITSYETLDSTWEKAVIGKFDYSAIRYKNIARLVNDIIKHKCDYVVLPELSLPGHWAKIIAQKLALNNISLIVGIEYLHDKEWNKVDGNRVASKIVRNSIYYFLLSDSIGYSYLRFIRQDKTIPAHKEAETLRSIANITLKADDKFKNKFTIQHGNLFFSSLICNELTDIENRLDKRGEIDLMIVIEWNQDIESFNALVEATALDVHCYVAQINNRQFGDSRIRVPHKESHKRDLIRIRGGLHDYFVIGEIDIDKLRKFQSHQISPDKDFKPLPTGFRMADIRKKWK